MLKLEPIALSYADLIADCADGIIIDTSLKERLLEASEDLVSQGNDYHSKASTGDFTQFSKNLAGNPVVVGSISAKEMQKIYTDFMAKKGKPARDTYDQILNAAKGKCPFCGIGVPRTLDHFLPKVSFAEFSILPWNLIPACRDCNTEMGREYTKDYSGQLLNPYFDHHDYFNTQWVGGEFICDAEGGGVIRFFANPPDNWSEVAKDRVINHFLKFKLSEVYGIKAAEQLPIVLEQIRSQALRGASVRSLQEDFLNPAITRLPPNTWMKTMYHVIYSSLDEIVSGF